MFNLEQKNVNFVISVVDGVVPENSRDVRLRKTLIISRMSFTDVKAALRS